MPTKKVPDVDGAELIQSAVRLELRPDDVLVFRSKEIIRPEFRVYLQKQIQRLFPNNTIVVIDGPIDIFVLNEEHEAE